MKMLISMVLVMFSFTLTSVSAHASERAEQGWRLVEQGALLIDVRTPQEFAAGHLEHARNYPLSEFVSHVALIDKSQPIVVYCRSGNRSGKAFDYLISQGYTQVHNAGGLEEMRSVQRGE
ncbi:rhodanese-like domain-containing protein [Vibrio sp. CAU 1672]|uniref:rhodanese-like domain-containing protein n=1 Tax=Vibrio sp. CAU 1672 TaxID=3032594 RepID=UPI0023DBD66A|nr:rhodanese-like domain-containing protein [Vibrio sp. CAU 1672]MDF2153831.1 rhodanese-like domain-containing protein [Vibrio sp. CAU 1672]